jgi:hypothetical protein
MEMSKDIRPVSGIEQYGNPKEMTVMVKEKYC